MKLEDIRPGVAVNGILPGEPVSVVQVEPHGSEALTLTYRTSSGRVDNRLLFRQDEFVQSWPEIVRLARQEAQAEQGGLFGDKSTRDSA